MDDDLGMEFAVFQNGQCIRSSGKHEAVDMAVDIEMPAANVLKCRRLIAN
jgi:hypothetical protein